MELKNLVYFLMIGNEKLFIRRYNGFKHNIIMKVTMAK